ncbi:hypothetical protein D3C84_450060 [compost metagenome]
MKGTRYGIRNAQLVEVGIGKYGIRGSSVKGFKLSCYVAVGIEVLEWVFNDEAVLSDLFAGVGVKLIKAGIATAIGYAAAMAAGALFTAAAFPVAVGAVVCNSWNQCSGNHRVNALVVRNLSTGAGTPSI